MSKSAKDLRVRMLDSANGWGQDDLRKLYTGFGFALRQGAKHTVYQHPAHAHLGATVPRHGTLLPVYARTALKLIQQLEDLEVHAPDAE